MGNNPGKPHTETFLEVISGTSPLSLEKREEVFRSITSNVSKKVLNATKNARGEGPVACACYTSNHFFLDTLLALGFEHSKDNAGNTPLHTATILRNEYYIEKISGRWPTLLTSVNSAGKTPLDIATESENSSVVACVVRAIERGDDPFSKYQGFIHPDLRKMFIHIDRFRNRVKADFAGGQSVIWTSDMLLPDGTSAKVVMKGATARATNGDAAILREIKVLQQSLNLDDIPNNSPTSLNDANYIIKFYGFTLDDRFAYLVSPYTPLGDLNRWIIHHELFYDCVDVSLLPSACIPPQSEVNHPFRPAFFTDSKYQETSIGFIRQIARGLRYLHAHNIIHNDIKPMNCLLFNEDGNLTIKLIDFGLSVIEQDPDFMNTPMASPATIPYVATERLSVMSIFSNPPSVKTDMYAFGASVWHLVTGKKPYYYAGHRTPHMKLPLLPVVYLGDKLVSFVNRSISNNSYDRPDSFDTIIDIDDDSDVSDTFEILSSDDSSIEVVVVTPPQSRPSSHTPSLVPSLNLSNLSIVTGPYRVPSPRYASEECVYNMHSPKEIDEFTSRLQGLTIVDAREIEMGPPLGEGNFGKVFRGTYDKTYVAVKTLKYVNSFSSEEKRKIFDEFVKEAVAMDDLRMVERMARVVCVTLNPMQLVMEYYQKGSVSDLLRREPDLHFITRVSIVKDIAEGIMNMHTSSHIHRDIAARNILVDEEYRAYISDFGKTRFSEVGYAQTCDKIIAVKWAAPESFSSSEELVYSTQTDVWAFGVTVFEILTNEEPYRGVSHSDMIALLRKKEGKFLELPETFDNELRCVVDKCLMWNPEDRSDMEEHYVILETYLEELLANRWWLGKQKE
jgi:serine/threonine protein kinase